MNRATRASAIPVLTYHAIADAASPIAVSPARFGDTMTAMHRAGWRTVSDEDLRRGLADGAWPARTFVLHFDDGFASVDDHARPVLASCGFNATIFVVSDWVGRDNGWPSQPAGVPRWPLLDWPALRRLRDAGFRIAPHSRSHPVLPALAPDAAGEELRGSVDRLFTELDVRSDVFAYPYGATNPAVQAAAAATYRMAYGTRLDLVRPGAPPFELPRVDAWYLTPARAASLDQPATIAWLTLRRALRRVRRLTRR